MKKKKRRSGRERGGRRSRISSNGMRRKNERGIIKQRKNKERKRKRRDIYKHIKTQEKINIRRNEMIKDINKAVGASAQMSS